MRNLDETFPGPALDEAIWLPAYLPHWSSRADAAPSYAIRADGLHLAIPPEHPLWCPDTHDEPIRISGIQSGHWSGPLGSTRGQAPFRPGLVVREDIPPFNGYTPQYGRIEIRMRGVISPRSMVACWMIGIEDRPERSGEICLVEIFGASVRDGSAEVGMGIHAFRDPALREDWSAERFPLDPAEVHTYAVEWAPGSVDFLIDGRPVRHADQAPDYPMQLMIAAFDFPDRATDTDVSATPELVVSHVRGRSPDGA
ncbi:MAG TPA: glycoside hydrolase family 16 protein [Candidatus Limnocylindrales bacterium]|nr:glycoside hydrolase family 16 protein [Candidatus Limnocylindrales bacterium]